MNLLVHLIVAAVFIISLLFLAVYIFYVFTDGDL